MNTQRSLRITALCSLVVALLVSGLALAISAAAPARQPGGIGQALLLRSQLAGAARAQLNAAAFVPGDRPRNGMDGRFIYDKTRMLRTASSNAVRLRSPRAVGTGTAQVSEAVETFDVFAPPAAFTPTQGTLTPTNAMPVWSADETYLVFTSNRDATGKVASDGHFHIWAIAANGGSAFQITAGPGNEYFPALNQANNKIAFISDANASTSAPGQDLYAFGIGVFTGKDGSNTAFPPAQAVDVSTLNPLPNRAAGANTYTGVGRPTWSPGDDRIAFAAVTVNVTGSGFVDPGAGHSHIYYIYTATGGYQSMGNVVGPNPPAELTSGLADDTDPAWSPDGRYIAFASTTSGFTSTGSPISPTTAPSVSAAPGTTRSIFLISGGLTSGFGSVPAALGSAGGRVTLAGTDDFGPAWSYNTSNQYFNPNQAFLFLAFARGAAPNQPHNIYYFRVINNVNSGNVTPESATNVPVDLNTVPSNPGQGDDPSNTYDDIYPSWAPFRSVFSITYSSNRSITYNDPNTALPSETPISLPRGFTVNNSTLYPNGYPNAVGANYVGIFETQVLNLDPPTLLRFNGTEVIHLNSGTAPVLPSAADPTGGRTRFVQPGTPINFTLRLSDREAGLDDNNVYLQIKDPDSRYQDTNTNSANGGLEHKVFATDPNEVLNGKTTDSGSASFVLYNGGFNFRGTPTTALGLNLSIGSGYSAIALNGGTVNFPHFFGTIAGHDGSDTLSLFNFGTGSPFPTEAQEYECEWVNPTLPKPGTTTSDYGTPYYLAGVDDQVAFSGVSHPARPNATSGAGATPSVEWLKMTRSPVQDGQGGVLYTASYLTPNDASDFYVDAIAYDKAAFPAVPAGTSGYVGRSVNWRIYDNVWGFTTGQFDGSNDILVVSDYALGQKFALSTFSGNTGLANLVPTLYGNESYMTDVDFRYLPNAVNFWKAPSNNTTPPNPPPAVNQVHPDQLTATSGNQQAILVWRGVLGIGTYVIEQSNTANGPWTQVANSPYTIPGDPNNANQRTTFTVGGLTNNGTVFFRVSIVVNGISSYSNVASVTIGGTDPVFQIHTLSFFSVLNGLGVDSYIDGTIDDGARSADGHPNVRSQRYSIWRILSRGPVGQDVLQAYAPTFQQQPAVADPVATANKFPAASVPVAARCVIWVSPYTGRLLTGAGSLDNPNTQNQLRQFVAAGGRLCVSGQSVASTLTSNGSINNSAAPDFLPGVLNAKWASSNNFGFSRQLTGAAGQGHRVSYDAFFNVDNNLNVNMNFFAIDGNGNAIYTPPSTNPVFLGNNYDASPPGYTKPTGGANTSWRTDGSLDQIGPYYAQFGRTNNLIMGQLDTITPVANTNTTPRTPQTDFTYGSSGGGSNIGLITNEDFATGSRFVFASFGLEGLGTEVYHITINQADFWIPRNNRPNVLHNIVCYLRTGTFTGTVRDTTGGGAGVPVPGATVYLLANEGVTIPGPRQTFSATTDSTGHYTIGGVEPGAYFVAAYKTGYSRAITTAPYVVEGDTSTNQIGLNINQLPAGAIAGKVTDASTGAPVVGATVKYVASDGQTTVTGQTDTNGNYAIQNVPVGSYNGTANLGRATSDTHAVTVASGQTTQTAFDPKNPNTGTNFTLPPQPGVITGQVTDAATGQGLNGATVTFTGSNGKAVKSVTTTTIGGVAGSYTSSDASGDLPADTYTVTASDAGYAAQAQTVKLAAGQTVPNINFALIKATSGELYGIVTDAASGSPLTGVTVSVVDTAGNAVTSTTTGAVFTGPDGKPANYQVTLLQGPYRVTASQGSLTSPAQSVTVPGNNGTIRLDFTGSGTIQPLHIFPAGVSFFSVPYDYTGIGGSNVFDAVFGSLNTTAAAGNRSHVFVWSPLQLSYLTDPTPPADTIHLGRGYWIKLNSPVGLTLAGTAPQGLKVSVPLQPAWNMIGVPSQSAINVSSLTFANPIAGGAPISFADASSAQYNLVSPTLYRYDTATGTYQPVIAANLTGGTSDTTLKPYQAYWIKANNACTLLIPTVGP